MNILWRETFLSQCYTYLCYHQCSTKWRKRISFEHIPTFAEPMDVLGWTNVKALCLHLTDASVWWKTTQRAHYSNETHWVEGGGGGGWEGKARCVSPGLIWLKLQLCSKVHLKRTSNYLFISAASHRYAGAEMLNMLSIARLSATC